MCCTSLGSTIHLCGATTCRGKRGKEKTYMAADRRIINPWAWQDAYGLVQANEVSDTQRVLYCAGQVSVDAEGNPLHPGDMSAQIAQSLDNLETVLDNAGFEMSDVVRLNFYTTDVDSTLEAWSSQIKERPPRTEWVSSGKRASRCRRPLSSGHSDRDRSDSGGVAPCSGNGLKRKRA